MAVDTQVIRDEALLDKLTAAREQILREIRKAVLGQDEAVEQVLLSLFVGGHSILTGVPGLAKTLLVKTIANVLDLSFKSGTEFLWRKFSFTQTNQNWSF